MTVETKSPDVEVKETKAYVNTIPAVDIIEQSNGVKIVLDVPGAIADTVDIDVKENTLKVTADSFLIRDDKALRYQRSFQISDEIHVAGISAKYENGVLTVTLPKSEEAKIHKVKVQF